MRGYIQAQGRINAGESVVEWIIGMRERLLFNNKMNYAVNETINNYNMRAIVANSHFDIISELRELKNYNIQET